MIMYRMVYAVLLLISISVCGADGGVCLSHQCDNNDRCIIHDWVCDGDLDCIDGSDEANCSNHTCDSSEFRCSEVHNCIPFAWRCDGDNDCTDNTDERDCGVRTCGTEDWSCATNGECVPLTFVCDGHPDCRDGSDENTTVCNNRTCTDDEFRCEHDGRCVSLRWRCDEDDDCLDGSDERDCIVEPCTTGEWKCSNSSQCISIDWLCDENHDCLDKSDEIGCAEGGGINTHQCSIDEFACHTGEECVNKAWLCDGDRDCTDGSDESNCTTVTCAHNQFKCHQSAQCILERLRCDHVKHCSDNSDEFDCPISCDSDRQFDCSLNGTGKNCISTTELCDGRNNCGAWEDENPHFCNASIANPCPTAGCQHSCVYTHIRHYCTCLKGFTLAADGKHCDDVDECDPQPGVCSQICENKKGSYKCSCRHGYIHHPLNHDACIAEGEEPKLLFANVHDLREVGVRSGEYRPVVFGLHRAVAVDFDFTRQLVFWSDTAARAISWANITDGSASLGNVSGDVSEVQGMAYDWIHGNLYWTDSVRNTIEVQKFGGETSWRRILIRNLDRPRAIVVDPRDGQHFMYWTSCGRLPRIERASMDGSNSSRAVLVSSGDIEQPTGLTIDYESNYLYWVDSKLRIIMRTDFNGETVLVQSSNRFPSSTYLKSPVTVSVFEEYLYWSDLETVWKVSKIPSLAGVDDIATKLVASHFKSVKDLRTYHHLRQPNATNACSEWVCSHLCLPKNSYPNVTCACPNDNQQVRYKLDAKRLNCIPTRFAPDVPGDSVSPSNGTDVIAERKPDNQPTYGQIAGIVCAGLVLCVLVFIVVSVICYRFSKLRKLKPQHFSNPLYRARESEDEFSLKRNEVAMSGSHDDEAQAYSDPDCLCDSQVIPPLDQHLSSFPDVLSASTECIVSSEQLPASA